MVAPSLSWTRPARAFPQSFQAALAVMALTTAGCGGTISGIDNDVVLSVPFQFVEDATGRSEFRLTGVNGNIDVKGVSAGETFTVTGFRRVANCSRSRAETMIEGLQVEVTVTGNAILVETNQPQNTESCSLNVDYELTVPERLFARISNVNGGITVDDLDEGLTLTNVNGNVVLDDLEDDVTVRLTNGNIVADAEVSGDHAVDLLTVNGNVALTIPTDTHAVVSISLANGAIVVSNLTFTNQTSTNTSLSGTLGTGEGAIILRTTNGNAALTGA